MFASPVTSPLDTMFVCSATLPQSVSHKQERLYFLIPWHTAIPLYHPSLLRDTMKGDLIFNVAEIEELVTARMAVVTNCVSRITKLASHALETDQSPLCHSIYSTFLFQSTPTS